MHSCQASMVWHEQDGQQNFFLKSEYFLQFGFGRTSSGKVTIVYLTVYKRKTNIFHRLLV